jgi:hypothetical protein
MIKFFAIIGFFLFGLLIAFLEAKVLLDMSEWFQIPYMDKFSFKAMYGLMAVKGLLFFKFKRSDNEDNDMEEILGKMFGAALSVLLAWGMAYGISHWIL